MIRAIVIAAVSSPAMGQEFVSWIGPATGSWNVAANWSGGVPNNSGGSQFNAFVDGGQPMATLVTVPIGNTFTINNLGVSSGDRIQIDSDASLRFVGTGGTGSINNAGTITLNSVFGGVGLLVNTASISLTGGGTVLMNGPVALIGGVDGAATLSVENTRIIGSGNIGIDTLCVRNGGTITASNGVNSLTIDAVNNGGTAGFFNTGTIQASGGTLILSGSGSGFFDNTGGRIIAGTTDARLITNADIRGGTLSSSGAGVIRIPAANSGTLTSVTNNGNVTLDNNSQLNLTTALINTGSINVNASANSATLHFNGVTLNGAGTINLSNTGAGTALVVGTGGLTSSSNIRGHGMLGGNSLVITSSGRIQASGGALTVDPATLSSFTNTGTLQALSGGTLILSGNGGGTFTSTAGTIDVQAGGNLNNSNAARLNAATVLLNGTWNINSGTVLAGRVTGAGAINQTAGSTTLTHFRTGTLNITGGSSLTLQTGNGTLATSSLSSGTINIGSTSFLDLRDGALVVDYSGASPLDAVSALLATGYNVGAWNGNGIKSSLGNSGSLALGYSEAADIGVATFGGLAVDATAVLVRYTRYGDANLNGITDIGDFARLAANFGEGPGPLPDELVRRDWVNGDFNYDQRVDIQDFALLGANFNQMAGDLPRNVPEPATLCLWAAWLATRRRRACFQR